MVHTGVFLRAALISSLSAVTLASPIDAENQNGQQVDRAYRAEIVNSILAGTYNNELKGEEGVKLAARAPASGRPAGGQVLTVHPVNVGNDGFIGRVATGVNTINGRPAATRAFGVSEEFLREGGSEFIPLSKSQIEDLFVAHYSNNALQKRDQSFDQAKFKAYIKPIVNMVYKDGVQSSAKYVQNGVFNSKQAATDLASKIQNGENLLQFAGRFLGAEHQDQINSLFEMIDNFSNGIDLKMMKRDEIWSNEYSAENTFAKRALVVGQLGGLALKDMRPEDIPTYEEFSNRVVTSFDSDQQLSKRAFNADGFVKNVEPYLKFAYEQFTDFVKAQTVNGQFNADKAAGSITQFVNLAAPLLKSAGVVNTVMVPPKFKLGSVAGKASAQSDGLPDVSNIIMNTIKSFSGKT